LEETDLSAEELRQERRRYNATSVVVRVGLKKKKGGKKKKNKIKDKEHGITTRGQNW